MELSRPIGLDNSMFVRAYSKKDVENWVEENFRQYLYDMGAEEDWVKYNCQPSVYVYDYSGEIHIDLVDE